MTFNSNVPGGVTFTLDQLPRGGPFTLDTLIDFQHTIEAPAATSSGGRLYEFAGWSNGVNSASQTIIVPDSDQTYTANYIDVGMAPRVEEGLQALYLFNEGGGTTVRDVSGVGTPLDLTISDLSDVTWQNGALDIDDPTLIASSGPATKLIDAITATNEITVEAWIDPANVSQGGPARIATLSATTTNRNFTLGGDEDAFNFRLRTTNTTNNGTNPSLNSPSGSLTADLTHVVYTREANGTAKIYVNDTEVADADINGNLSNWNSNYKFALGNELTENRPWLGSLDLVAVYGQALSPTEISQNYTAGPNPFETPSSAPTLTANSLTISEGQSVTLNASNLAATAPDIDDDLLVFSVSNVAGGQFEVTGSPATSFTQMQVTSGQVTFAHDDGETPPAYDVTVSDGALSDGPEAAAITFSNVNDNAPVIPAGQSFTVSESAVVGALVGTVAFSDADLPGDSFATMITAGDDLDVFDIDNLGNLTVADSLDANTTPSYTLTVQIDDGVNVSSEDVNVTVQEASQSDFINFNDFTITSYGGQDGDSTATIENGGTALRIDGNGWKKINFPYSVTSDTVLEFDYQSSRQGEIHGIGFDNNDATSGARTFRLYGTQNFGIGAFDDYDQVAPAVKHYRIPVGQFYTESAQYLFFVNDHDGGIQDGQGVFSNIRVFEEGAAGSPMITANNLSLDEGESVTLTGANLAATDSDSNDASLIFTVSGVTGGEFQAATTTVTGFTQAQVTAGEITFVHDDGEAAPAYNVSVSDGTLTGGPAAASISFTNVNDNAPIIAANQMFTVSELAGVGTFVGSVSFTDVDQPGDNFTMMITAGDDLGAFDIDNAGALTVAGSLDSDTTPSYTLTIQIDDGANVASEDVVVNVQEASQSGFINFNNRPITSYGTQDGTSTITVEDGGTTLRIVGNAWKKIDFPYEITSDTVIEFDFQSSKQGDIQGIGFDNNNGISGGRTFRLYGTQSFGKGDFDDYQQDAPAVKHYRIPVGQFYTGSHIYLFFVNDHDGGNQDGEGVYSNIQVYEAIGTGQVAVASVHQRLDTNGDGRVTPLDVLLIVNELNEGANSEDVIANSRLDVDGDNLVSTADAVRIVARLNVPSIDRANTIGPSAEGVGFVRLRFRGLRRSFDWP